MQQLSITLAMTGASGASYGLRLLEQLIMAGKSVNVLISQAGLLVLEDELDLPLPNDSETLATLLCELYGAALEQLKVYTLDDWRAPVATGSKVGGAMVICPCTTGCLAAIAQGQTESLIERAAEVALKEKRPLILVIRETPLSEIQLENMLKLARMGVTIMPASPGFYHRPKGALELVDFMVTRILQHLGIEALPRQNENKFHLSNCDSSVV